MNDNIRYLSIKQVADSNRYPFTIGQMRHFLMMRHRNKLNGAVIKIGKRLYLRTDLFEKWIESQAGRGGHNDTQ